MNEICGSSSAGQERNLAKRTDSATLLDPFFRHLLRGRFLDVLQLTGRIRLRLFLGVTANVQFWPHPLPSGHGMAEPFKMVQYIYFQLDIRII